MPHIPSQFAPTSGVRPDLIPPAREHTGAPPPPNPVPPKNLRNNKLRLPKINPRTYEPDINDVARALFGRPLDFDDRTGILRQT